MQIPVRLATETFSAEVSVNLYEIIGKQSVQLQAMQLAMDMLAEQVKQREEQTDDTAGNS